MTPETDSQAGTSKLRQIATRLAEWWARPPGQSELDGVSAEEVARMAADLGLSASDLERLAARDNAASLLLYRRLAQLGLSREDIEEAGFRRDLERTCGLCAEHGDCLHDLEMRADSDEWRAYCPNRHSLELLEAAKKQKGGSGSQT
ncbi:MAG: hypothetical protein ACKVP7_24925 [Hyphomicrobiaceae bacterium]